jgi:phosphoribosylformylglycinamidine synthase
VEVRPSEAAAFEAALAGLPCARVGQTARERRLRIAGRNGEWAVWAALEQLKEAWQRPLRW